MKTDAVTDVTMDATTDAVYSAETAATACAGSSFSFYSADVVTTIHLVPQTDAAATTATTTTAAVLSSGSSYYPASVVTEAFSKTITTNVCHLLRGTHQASKCRTV